MVGRLDGAGRLGQPLDGVARGARVHRVVLLPAEEHGALGGGVPQLGGAVRGVGRHAARVPVVDGAVVGAHHPGVLAAPAARPLVLVLVVDDGEPSGAVRDVQHALVDVEPEDVHVGGDVVGGEGQFGRQVVDPAVVTARVDPEVVGDQALDAVRELVAGEDLAAVGEGVDVARLIAHPALVLVDVDAESRRAGAEPPQDRGDRAGRGGCGGHLPAGDRAGRAPSLHGGLVPLADLLGYLPGRGGLGLPGGGEGRRLGLSGGADPAVAHRHDLSLDGDFVELVRAPAVLRQLQVRPRHGRPLPGRTRGVFRGFHCPNRRGSH